MHILPAGQSAPLSTTPSQSSSWPLHVSGLAGTDCLHRTVLLTHATVPAWQAPRLPVRQAEPTATQIEPHFVMPAAHLQLPLRHVWSEVQKFPHEPQLAGSDCVAVHVNPQRDGALLGQQSG